MTPQERADLLIDGIYRERMSRQEIIDYLTALMTQTRRAALLECREEISTLMGKDAGNWNRAIVYAADVANKLAQEGY